MTFTNPKLKKLLQKYLILELCLATAIAMVIFLWHASKPELMATTISPRKVYRLENYKASPLQRLWHYNMKMPSFIRLYRIEPETLIAESDVVDLWLNGKLDWFLEPPLNSVWVGNDIVFENIPPECTDCPPLTDREMMP